MAIVTKLREIGNAEKDNQIRVNPYKEDPSLNYNATHPNAVAYANGSDDPNNVKGKEPSPSDGPYTNAGGSIDINGSLTFPGSGRINNLRVNSYNPDNPYPWGSIE